MSNTVNSKVDVEIKYSSLLKDQFFDQLSLETKKPNIFRALGVSDYEIRHSNFLAWLLDPHENHGLGNIVLKKFFYDVLVNEKAKNISIISVAKLDISKVEIRREWKNIDILIITETFIISIENKLWASESKDQLADYEKIVKAEFPGHEYCFVFLTPYGQSSSIPKLYIEYSYIEIVDILERVLTIRETTINSSTRVYLNDYITLIKQNIMSDDTVNDLAKKLYFNHKDLFDFVFENKPDYYDKFYSILSEKVEKKGWVIGSKNKGFVRFLTPKLLDLIPKYKEFNGWPGKEALLFQFSFKNGEELKFSTVISPFKGSSIFRGFVNEILKELEESSPPDKNNWRSYFREILDLPLELNTKEWNAEYGKEIDKFIEKITPIVHKVEAQFMKYEDKLKKIKVEIENE